MERVTEEIDEMYTDLMTSSKSQSYDVDLKQLNEIKDSFRQHINKRRNEEQKDLIMDEQLIEKLKNVKVLSHDILQKFRDLNTSVNTGKKQMYNLRNFINLEEFNRHISSQQEILNSELWKIDVFLGFLLDK